MDGPVKKVGGAMEDGYIIRVMDTLYWRLPTFNTVVDDAPL